jgi:hypothetical protein
VMVGFAISGIDRMHIAFAEIGVHAQSSVK